MALYLICLLFPLLLSMFNRFRTNSLFVVLLFFLLFILSSYRTVGTDVPAYKTYFDSINFYSLDYSLYEKGYFLLNKIVRLFTDNFQYVLIFSSIITLFPIFFTIKKYSINPALSIFYFVSLYFYFNSFNLIRQYIVVSWLFFSIRFIIEKKLLPFLLIVLCASFFHITALFFIPFYWIVRLRFSSFSYLLMSSISLVFVFITPFLIRIISRVFPKFNYYEYYELQGASANFTILLTGITFMIGYFLRKNIKNGKNEYNIYLNFIFFAFCLALLSINNIMFFRLASYLYIFIILFLPILLFELNSRIKPLAYFSSSIILILYCINLIKNNNGGIYPYDMSPMAFDKYFTLSILLILSFSIIKTHRTEKIIEKRNKNE